MRPTIVKAPGAHEPEHNGLDPVVSALLIRTERLAQTGSFDVDLTSETATWSPELHRMLGIPLETPPRRGMGIERVHPEDRAAFEASVHQAVADGAPLTTVVRIIRDGNETRWLRLSFECHGSPPRTERVTGFVQDITDIVQLECERNQATERWRALLSATSDTILTVNAEGRISSISRLKDGRPLDQVLGRHYLEFVTAEDRPVAEHAIEHVFATGEPRSYVAWSPRAGAEAGRYEVQVVPRLYGGHVYEVILVARDVTERLRYETTLEQARRAAEMASRAKSTFVANMSHELRTPLNSIIGFAELLAQQTGGPLTDRQRGYVEHLRLSGRHLLSLINDVLDLAKVEAGRMHLVREPTSLAHVADAVRGILQPLADKGGVALSVDIDAALPALAADPTRLKQILYNLVSNAIKFTPPGGAIVVSGRAESDAAALSVRDTGVGIPQESLSRLFVEFEQLEQPDGRRPEGTGLGLALVKHLAELHGGSVSVDSEVGRGSTFTVRLPVARETRA